MLDEFAMKTALAADALGLPQKLENLKGNVAAIAWQDAAWSLGVTLAALIGGRVVAALILRGFERWAARTETHADDAVIAHLGRPLRWLVPLLALRLLMPLLVLPEDVLTGTGHLLSVAVIGLAGWFAFKLVRVGEVVVTTRYDLEAEDNLTARAVHTQMRGLRNILGFVISVVTLGLVLMTFDAVRQLGTGILASAGVAGIVLGFAAQRSIATVLAGIQIAMSQPIRVDDVVIVEGEWGKIEEITLTYVVVRIWDLRRLVVPIMYFIERPFQNWTRTSAELLGTVELHLDYSVPVDAIREEFKRILDASPDWDQKVWGVQVTGANERSVIVRPLMSARDAGAAWNLRCEVREKLIRFVQVHYPEGLPRLRAELETSPGKNAA